MNIRFLGRREFKIQINRVVSRFLLGFCLLSQFACTATGGSLMDSREEDLSKIYVTPFTASATLELPSEHVDAARVLTRALEQQLLEENRLQTASGIHSLTLQGVILSYQAGVIEVQGELYDDDEFLVYSRVKRHLEPGDDWQQDLDLVVEQMLDDLMRKMADVQREDYVPYYATTASPRYFVVDNRYYYGVDYYSSVYYDPYYADWGWWRHYPRRHYHHDEHHDNGHDHHPYPRPEDKPKPKPHWVSDGIIESLPRSAHISQERNRQREEAARVYRTPRSGGFNGYWRGDGQSDSNPYTPPSAPRYNYAPPSSTYSAPSTRTRSEPQRSAPSYSPPTTHREEHRMSEPVKSAPAPAPAPRVESPAPRSNPPASGSRSFSGAAPGSHKNKRD